MRALAIAIGLLAPAAPASAQWYAAGFLGNAATSSVRLEVSSSRSALTIEPVELRDESSASPWYYGARVTKRLARARWLGVEGEFIHAKVISDPRQSVQVRGRRDGLTLDAEQPLGSVLPRFELSHGLNFILANVALFCPIGRSTPDPTVVLVGRFGAGPTVPHVEATFDGRDEDGYQLGRLALGGTVGAQIRLFPHVAAVAEFKVTRTTQRVNVGDGHLEGTFVTRHALAGIVWHTRR